ncbi:Uncharacterised protein [uncultured archaeon]|nr:Uncharacterised protein [uncultured archaeon]
MADLTRRKGLIKADAPRNHHHFKESSWRSLAKTATYRLAILIMDFVVIYWLTGKTEVAFGFMVVSNTYSSIGYYLHERVWDNVKWGKIRNSRKR